MRFPRDQSELVRRFGLETGRALRSAQWHRKNQTAEWKEFMARRAGVAEKLERDAQVVGPPPVPGEAITQSEEPVAMAREARTREEEMELSAYVNWRATMAIVRDAIRTRDTNLSAYLRAEGEAQKRFREARRLREGAEMAAGRLRPASEFGDLLKSVVMPLNAVLKNLPQEAGPRCNPFDHSFAIAALKEWLIDRYTPAFDRAVRELKKYETIPQTAG
jgi:hypothetical protein